MEEETCPRCGCCSLFDEICEDCAGRGSIDDGKVECASCQGTGTMKICIGSCDEDGNHSL
jgi:hypothetical protein